jgi:hypothetical protein
VGPRGVVVGRPVGLRRVVLLHGRK